ncbi:MAG: DUF2181 domain-containing protein [Proteobacteria bacterium]|nr:DUF2181 domain-containing protein [Pseudomonadota bacterium]MBI3498667.1 DUF2181 domain-containing protein [Pseudomonadota bacterium]
MLSDIPAFFGLGTPGEMNWAHGVNSSTALDAYLSDADTHVIEADISWLPEAGGVMMAHPPASTSDLTFEAWIEAVAGGGKGAKLDFKHPAVVDPCLAKLTSMRAAGRLAIPIMLNADVLPGPGGDPSLFQAAGFIARCGAFREAVLSLGWTTGPVAGGSYSEAMALDMLRLAAPVDGRVTVCLRAAPIAASSGAVARLQAAPGAWITVWNGRADPLVTPAEARRLTDPRRSFYDLIDAQGHPLR